MELDNYTALAERTVCDYSVALKNLQNPTTVRLLHAAMGLASEAGELHDQLKRHVFYGKELDLTNVAEELGDSMWYIAEALNAAKVTLNSICEKNIAKLQVRYPEKFTQDAALNRDLTAERKVLETV